MPRLKNRTTHRPYKKELMLKLQRDMTALRYDEQREAYEVCRWTRFGWSRYRDPTPKELAEALEIHQLMSEKKSAEALAKESSQ